MASNTPPKTDAPKAKADQKQAIQKQAAEKHAPQMTVRFSPTALAIAGSRKTLFPPS